MVCHLGFGPVDLVRHSKKICNDIRGRHSTDHSASFLTSVSTSLLRETALREVEQRHRRTERTIGQDPAGISEKRVLTEAANLMGQHRFHVQVHLWSCLLCKSIALVHCDHDWGTVISVSGNLNSSDLNLLAQ